MRGRQPSSRGTHKHTAQDTFWGRKIVTCEGTVIFNFLVKNVLLAHAQVQRVEAGDVRREDVLSFIPTSFFSSGSTSSHAEHIVWLHFLAQQLLLIKT